MRTGSTWITVGLGVILIWFGWAFVLGGTNLAIAAVLTSLVFIVAAAALLGERHVLAIGLAGGIGTAIGWSGNNVPASPGIAWTFVTLGVLVAAAAVAFFVAAGAARRFYRG